MAQKLKILTWNCNGAFRKKYTTLTSAGADIYVIQECENPELSKDEGYKEWAKNAIWVGDNKNKGLGIFVKDGVFITDLQWDTAGLKHFIACRINGEFNLIVTWCHGADLPNYQYIGQFWKYLQLHKLKFEKCIIAGDFNSNAIWDKKSRSWNHSDVVRELDEIAVVSLYHKYYEQIQGEEHHPTFYLQKNLQKPYHLDYVFASVDFAAKMIDFNIGLCDDWLVRSDRLPLHVQFEISIEYTLVFLNPCYTKERLLTRFGYDTR